MQFYTTNVTGDSGLFYLGHFIVQNFKFPFRVMSTDIGIDAEIELIGEGLQANGLIIKAQIKSTQKAINANFTEYVEKKHLEYWNKLTIPVLYFKVDLSNLKIYYKVISSFDDIERTVENQEEKWKINFDISSDVLKVESKEEWLEKFKAVEYHNLYSYFNQIDQILRDVITNVMDDIAFDIQMAKVQNAKKIATKLESLKILYPWKFGNNLTNELDRINNNIRIMTNDLNHNITQANYN